MKKLLLILFVVGYAVTAQTDGLSYQSVIIDAVVQEIPGVDVKGNVLANETIEVRFTILNGSENAEYREVQTTRTDAFGLFSVIIGRGTTDFGVFNEIVWDGTPKDLKVEIKLTGAEFKFQENKELLFIPYAFHRDVFVTETLAVDGSTILKDNLLVEGRTLLNRDLFVNNESETMLNGSLRVDGATILNDSLTVTNNRYTYLSGSLNVTKETVLRDSLLATRRVRLKSDLRVDEETNIGNGLNVETDSPTVLTGSLLVDGETNIYSSVNVNNGSNVAVSGDLLVGGNTVFDQDLTVNGITNLNNNLNVNNAAPTALSGTLTTQGASRFETALVVDQDTDLDGNLNVNAQSPTQLSGTLAVDETTDLNNSLTVNNLSPTDLSGDLTVGGAAIFNDDVTIEGVTNLNNTLFVNNNAATRFSGVLEVDEATRFLSSLDVVGVTNLQNTLLVNNGSNTNLSGAVTVDDATTLNNGLLVANESISTLNGTLTVDGASLLNNDLAVTGGAPTSLTGTLDVDRRTILRNGLEVLNNSATVLSGGLRVIGEGTLNNTLRVNNGTATSFTGLLDVDGVSTFNNVLNVANAGATGLSGTLTVGGAAVLNNTLDVTGFTLINNDLTVSPGNSSFLLGGVSVTDLKIEDDVAGNIATFENTNETDGDGILIQLGRTHGAYNGPAGTNNPSDYLQVNNPYLSVYQAQLDFVGGLLADPNSATQINITDITNLIPAVLVAGQLGSIGNSIIERINSSLGLPISTPAVVVPAFTIVPEVTIFGGSSRLCSGRYCFNPCTFFDCTICIPPIEFCVPALPRIYIPRLRIDSFTVLPSISPFFPAIPAALPQIGPGNLLTLPNITFGTVSNSMNKQNQFMSFQDNSDRETGSIMAQSTADFLGNTILDQVYVINVLAGFVGVDLVGGLVNGANELSKLVDAFNKLGVSYKSGNGDYAEWLPREDISEYITAGDIVAIRGGKISKNLTEAEQVLVVSHKPIVLGNNPNERDRFKGNSVAFMGQVPVKVLGPVQQGDFIVADTTIKGYGRAVSIEKMMPRDYKLAVGRSWETNSNEGPKLVKIVVGVHANSWANEIIKIEQQQQQLDHTIESLEERIQRISKSLEGVTSKNTAYASNLKK
jgi:hypothetical protein